MSQFISTACPNLFRLHVPIYFDCMFQFILIACPKLFPPNDPIRFDLISKFCDNTSHLFRLHVTIYFSCISEFISTPISEFISTACLNLFFCISRIILTACLINMFRLRVSIYFDCICQFISTACPKSISTECLDLQYHPEAADGSVAEYYYIFFWLNRFENDGWERTHFIFIRCQYRIYTPKCYINSLSLLAFPLRLFLNCSD